MGPWPHPGAFRHPFLMSRRVEIDPKAGFCGGVIRAIGKAEAFLEGSSKLFSLGAIVHNEAELDRLASKGLSSVKSVAEVPEGEPILIRAHGEPPSTYAAAASREIIDCTCPVVLQLQKRIREAHARLREGGRNGTLVIFGKIGHAEVLGLLGQVDGDAIVVEDKGMLEEALKGVDLNEKVEVFSQTTKSPADYKELCDAIAFAMEKVRGVPPGNDLVINDTICLQVASRYSSLREFALAHDAIVFVSGTSSSNGKVLFELCRKVNPRTFRVGSSAEIDPSWFRPEDSIGVSGATSTPKWLLEEVAENLKGI